MVRTLASLVAAAALLASAPSAGAVTKIVTKSPDSLAPKNAPAHWLPPEAWVYNHWLPYDEGRLYSVLGITRSELWQQLRDDKRTLAQLAARKGFSDPRALAARLVAPRASSVSPSRLAQLQNRAERTITQGHLAQHLFFHSLHQFALPSAAPELFGVTDRRFRELRRAELSPLQIARLNGLSVGQVQAQAIAVLRDRLDAGVAGGAMTSKQAKILERRQLSQLPRWLDQQRYNGPPTTTGGALTNKPQDYASNAAISADGNWVAYEAYRQKLPLAIKLGEIAVLRANLTDDTTSLVSAVNTPDATGSRPSSAYNPSISGDGSRVVFEQAAGNQNFGKRYGRIGVMLCDLTAGASGHPEEVTGDAEQPAESDSRSAYNPVVSADGSTVAYQATTDGRTAIVVERAGTAKVVVTGRKAGGTKFSDPYEPGLSADGTRVVYTSTEGKVGDEKSGGSSVYVRDLAAGKTIEASAGVAGLASDPAISADGRYVTFTTTGAEGSKLYLRDLKADKASALPVTQGSVLDPVVSGGGEAVAFTLSAGARSQVLVWARDSGRADVVSQPSGTSGIGANGRSDDPTISQDGKRIVFSSTASNLTPGRTGSARGIYLRDLTTSTTRLVSDPAKAYEVAQ